MCGLKEGLIKNLNRKRMNIAVVGTGYVGLVTGTCFAETGNHVICVDIDVEKVERLRKGDLRTRTRSYL